MVIVGLLGGLLRLYMALLMVGGVGVGGYLRILGLWDEFDVVEGVHLSSKRCEGRANTSTEPLWVEVCLVG